MGAFIHRGENNDEKYGKLCVIFEQNYFKLPST